jgi:hypothetical protein
MLIDRVALNPAKHAMGATVSVFGGASSHSEDRMNAKKLDTDCDRVSHEGR